MSISYESSVGVLRGCPGQDDDFCINGEDNCAKAPQLILGTEAKPWLEMELHSIIPE